MLQGPLAWGSTILMCCRASGRVHLYSLRNQAYVYSLKFNSRVLGLRCSTRLLVVALDAQLHAFDATSLSHVFSAVTYPAPCTHQLYQSETCAQGTAVALALGSRWLAFASNQVGTPLAHPPLLAGQFWSMSHKACICQPCGVHSCTMALVRY